MKEKERFLGTFGVLNVSLSVVVFLMISVGFFGYYKFGDDVQDTLTRNLDAKSDMYVLKTGNCNQINTIFCFLDRKKSLEVN